VQLTLLDIQMPDLIWNGAGQGLGREEKIGAHSNHFATAYHQFAIEDISLTTIGDFICWKPLQFTREHF